MMVADVGIKVLIIYNNNRHSRIENDRVCGQAKCFAVWWLHAMLKNT